MRKIHLFFVAMSLFIIAACEKQPMVDEIKDSDTIEYNEDGSYVYTINATASDVTKSDYDVSGSTGTFKWSAGDAISVLFHKDSDNKFFTLTTSAGDGSFSGVIDAGYTIGASDGTDADKKIWALFPASTSHTYTEGNSPSFNLPNVTDFSSSHFSANLPMYDLKAAEGDLSFKNLSCAYKFTVTNIDATKAPKIKAVVTNQLDYALSGTISMGSNYLKFNESDLSHGGSKTVSYVCDVTYDSDPTKGTAVFYVATRAYQAYFKPTISINNYSTDSPIKTFTATKAPDAMGFGVVKPITLDVSEGEYFSPAITIDGSFSDWSSVTTSLAGVNSFYLDFKATYDKYYLYFYSKRNWQKNLWATPNDGAYYYYFIEKDNNTETGTTKSQLPDVAGIDFLMYLYIFTGTSDTPTFPTNPTGSGYPSSSVIANVTAAGSTDKATIVETEVRIPRSDAGVAKGNTIKVYTYGSKDAGNINQGYISLTLDN